MAEDPAPPVKKLKQTPKPPVAVETPTDANTKLETLIKDVLNLLRSSRDLRHPNKLKLSFACPETKMLCYPGTTWRASATLTPCRAALTQASRTLKGSFASNPALGPPKI